MVLVHLNHRLVQMCLGLLRAEVWRHRAGGRSTGSRPARAGHRATRAGGDRPRPAGRDRRRQRRCTRRSSRRAASCARGASRASTSNAQVGRGAGRRHGGAGARGSEDEAPRALAAHSRRRSWPALEARAGSAADSLRRMLGERARQGGERHRSGPRRAEAGSRARARRARGPPSSAALHDRRAGAARAEPRRPAARLAAIPAEIERETAAIAPPLRRPEARFFPVAVPSSCRVGREEWLMPAPARVPGAAGRATPGGSGVDPGHLRAPPRRVARPRGGLRALPVAAGADARLPAGACRATTPDLPPAQAPHGSSSPPGQAEAAHRPGAPPQRWSASLLLEVLGWPAAELREGQALPPAWSTRWPSTARRSGPTWPWSTRRAARRRQGAPAGPGPTRPARIWSASVPGRRWKASPRPAP